MSPAPIPPNESQRLRAVESLGEVDQARLDLLCRLLGEDLGIDAATVNLVLADREIVAGSACAIDFDDLERSRSQAFCAWVIAEDGAMVVTDASRDARFKDYEDVVAGRVRSYAGVPLHAPEGDPVGTLCVRSPEVGRFGEVDLAKLRSFAALAEAVLCSGAHEAGERRQRALARRVVESSLAGQLVLTPVRDASGAIVDFTIVLANAATCDVCGLKRSVVEGGSLLEIFPASRDAGFFDHYVRVVEHGEPVTFQLGYDDDRLRGCYVCSAMLLEGNVLVSFLDVSELIEARDRLDKVATTLRHFIEHVPNATAMFDREMRYVACTRQWITTYGLEGEDLIGRSHYEVFPELPSHWREMYKRCMAGEVFSEEEERFERADGRVQYVRWALHPWRTDAGEIGGIIVITQDVTEHVLENRVSRVLSQAIDGVDDAVYWLDRQGRIRFSNGAAVRMLGYTEDEFAQMTVFDIDEDVTPQQFMRMWDASSTGYHQPIERLHSTSSGQRVPVEISATKFNFEGESMVCCLVRDIGDRKAAEARLKLSEQRLSLAMAAANEGMWDWDLEANEVFYSDEWYRVLGYEPGELPMRSETWERLVHPDDLVTAKHAIESYLAGHSRAYLVEVRMRAADGSYRWVTSVGRAVAHSREGRPTRIIGVHIDVTDRHNAEQDLQRYAEDLLGIKVQLEMQAATLAAKNNELERARREAEEASRAKSAFLANMSHELRTPLTAIMGYAELLLDSGISDHERHAHLCTVRRNGEHLLTLVNDILDLSRVEAGRLPLELTECDLISLMSETIEMHQPRARESSVALFWVAFGPIPPSIRTDPMRLRQVLVNIIGNAVKFTKDGEVGVSVRFDPTPGGSGGGSLCFDVVDTGIGMTVEQATKVFRPFTQADASMSRRFGGSGLGLAISRRLAEVLGGEVELVSTEPDEGTHMRLRLELSPDAVLAPPSTVEDTGGATAGWNPRLATGPIATDLTGLRVLLAEDGPDNRRLVTHYLSRAGADVVTAENGLLAVRAVDAAVRAGRQFDVILMDMQMPEMDGYTATRELRTLGYGVPVLALTAHAMAGDKQRCFDAGCDAYLAKPIDRNALLAACSTAARTKAPVSPKWLADAA